MLIKIYHLRITKHATRPTIRSAFFARARLLVCYSQTNWARKLYKIEQKSNWKETNKMP